MRSTRPRMRLAAIAFCAASVAPQFIVAQQAPPTGARQDATPTRSTQKPPLHGRHWVAVTGKPLSAAAGAMIFQQGGNAIDAACAMLAAGATMWDVLSWGGETQALIYNPRTRKVVGINALGVAPSGATPEYYRSQGYNYPPEFGPLAAVTPGTPGGLTTMLAEFGTMSLAQVLAPAIQMADGYAIEAQTANSMETNKAHIKQWKYSPAVFLPHLGESREAPEPGEVFRQPDLAATLRKLVDAEATALKNGASRRDAIMAAYDRFYRGDIAEELVRGARESGALFTTADLANWKVKIEEPFSTNYKGIEVYKLRQWQQGPVLLQALNMLEGIDVKSMGHNSARYMHTIYQVMNLAFADRDFYYGDPDFAPDEPMRGLLSKDYARARAKLINATRNDTTIKPGDPYPFQGETNPFREYLDAWPPKPKNVRVAADPSSFGEWLEAFYAGTTSIQAADSAGWVVSVTPSGGWVPAVIAGRTGVGLSQRGQSFVTDPRENPFNVIAPGKRPRVTLTPTLAMKDGAPWMAFSVQGGDSQDQNLLQYFLNVVEFGMTPQQAVEAPNINSFQMMNSFDNHQAQRGRMLVASSTPAALRTQLQRMGYTLQFAERTSGPITAIWFDRKHGTMWGAASNHGEDYGIAW
ncbi:MAG TPA: gamma-glutamyltransferase [Gemmatimonadaceae bacterium]|nr:gamma-glutamyltransferase [Gemmatimonadaceae bacterium]